MLQSLLLCLWACALWRCRRFCPNSSLRSTRMQTVSSSTKRPNRRSRRYQARQQCCPPPRGSHPRPPRMMKMTTKTTKTTTRRPQSNLMPRRLRTEGSSTHEPLVQRWDVGAEWASCRFESGDSTADPLGPSTWTSGRTERLRPGDHMRPNVAVYLCRSRQHWPAASSCDRLHPTSWLGVSKPRTLR